MRPASIFLIIQLSNSRVLSFTKFRSEVVQIFLFHRTEPESPAPHLRIRESYQHTAHFPARFFVVE